jgi:hypothetical protein
MIDLETAGVGPDACILTIAAQVFDPLKVTNFSDLPYGYWRVDIDSQPDRQVDQSTIEWWATQPKHIQDEAFSEGDRVSLSQALTELGKMIWHSTRFWAQGPTFDATILEHAYKSNGQSLPWKFWSVRDSRTLFSLVPNLPSHPASHNALEDCRRQVNMLHDAFKILNIREIK